jgi:hypothetical protein
VRHSLLLMLVPAICSAQGHPRLVLDAPDFDFGRVAEGTVLHHRFKATNAGDAPLTITRLLPGCGCTSAVMGKSLLAPGESTGLEVTFNTTGESGSVRKSVQVVTDDPDAPLQSLYFEAKVLLDVTPSSDQVLFLDLTREAHPKASIKLTSGTGLPIKVGAIDLPEAPWLGVSTRAEGNDLWVDFDLAAARLPMNQLHGTDTIVMHLENPAPSVVKLAVRWEVRAPVSASPARVAWTGASGQDLRATVRLQHRQQRPFRILSARTSSPLLRVAVSPSGSAPVQLVQLTLSSAATPGSYQETVFLTLDTPGHPVLEIRVVAYLH